MDHHTRSGFGAGSLLAQAWATFGLSGLIPDWLGQRPDRVKGGGVDSPEKGHDPGWLMPVWPDSVTDAAAYWWAT